MDGARRDATRLDEPAADDADGPGDLRRALDELTAADDDDRVRRVIDALIHPRPAAASGGAGAASGGAAATAPEPSTRVSGAAEPAARGAGDLKAAPDDLGLCPVDTWRRLLDVEHASAARYGARTTVVLMEVSDAGAVEAALGEAAVSRLVGVLADTVRGDTRAADTFARIGRWRIAGLLPHTDGRAADAAIRRVSDGFGRRVGSGLPLRLAVGRAEVDPSLHPDATLTRAGGSMTAEPRRAVEHDSRGTRVEVTPEVEHGSRSTRGEGAPEVAADPSAGTDGPVVAEGPGPDERDGRSRAADTPVLASLRDLDVLRAGGLVTNEEYRKARRRILRRI